MKRLYEIVRNVVKKIIAIVMLTFIGILIIALFYTSYKIICVVNIWRLGEKSEENKNPLFDRETRLINWLKMGKSEEYKRQEPISEYYEVKKIVDKIYTLHAQPFYKVIETDDNSSGRKRHIESFYDPKGRLLQETIYFKYAGVSDKYGSGGRSGVSQKYYWYDENGNMTHKILDDFYYLSKYDDKNRKIEYKSCNKWEIESMEEWEYYKNGKVKQNRLKSDFTQVKDDYTTDWNEIREESYSEDGRWLSRIVKRKSGNELIIIEILEPYEWNEKGEYTKYKKYKGNREKLLKNVGFVLDENGKVISNYIIEGGNE